MRPGAAPRLELAEVHAWSGRLDAFEIAWEAALVRLPLAEQPAA